MKRALFATALLCAAIPSGQAGVPASVTQQDVTACKGDALRFCLALALIADYDGVYHCLVANKAKISPACRAALHRHGR